MCNQIEFQNTDQILTHITIKLGGMEMAFILIFHAEFDSR